MSLTVPVNTAVAVQAAWHGGPVEAQEQAQAGARDAASTAIEAITRMTTLDTDWREDGVCRQQRALQQLDKLVGGQVRIPKDASEQGVLDGLPSMHRHDGSCLCDGLN